LRISHSDSSYSVEGRSSPPRPLAETWPKRSGRAYFAALRACLNCLSDACEPEIPHKAFLAAAKDAGVFIRLGRRGERDR
jgi:hypothetical protein